MSLPPFHIAVPVKDLEASRRFYTELLGCSTGRESSQWIDFNLYGHQWVCHLAPDSHFSQHHNPVDGESVPVPHYGLILPMEEWQTLADRLSAAGVDFIIPPTVRFRGQIGEQATLFFSDPSGNALEFKAFADPSQLFAS